MHWSEIMTVINGAALTTFEVAQDGRTASIHVEDQDSNPSSLVSPSECVQALMMTFPEMMRQALQRRYGDSSLTLVYPLAQWQLTYSTEPGKLILTLSTSDGFSVSFAVNTGQIAAIATSATKAELAATPKPN